MSADRTDRRLPSSYFDAVYDGGLDPWGFESRWYEQRKRTITLAALPRPRYRRAFEPGCAIGLLTRELAGRCDEVVAWDLHPAVVSECETRCADLTNVRIATGAVPDRWPPGEFDLVLLSEVAYYLDVDGIDVLVGDVQSSLVPGGAVVAVHWLGETDYPLTGAETHRLLDTKLGLRHQIHHSDPEFVLDVWERDRP